MNFKKILMAALAVSVLASAPLYAEDAAAEAGRVGRAATLGAPASRKAVRELLAMLGDPSAQVRAKVCQSLGMQNHDKAVQPLIAVLASDADARVRAAAAKALGQIQNKAATNQLSRALASDSDENVRAASAIALGRLLDGKAVFGPLAAALKDKSDTVRSAVATALGYEDGYAAGRLLTYLVLLDKNPDVRAAAANGLSMCCSNPNTRVDVNAGIGDPWYYWDPFWDPLPVESVEVKLGKLSDRGLDLVVKTLLYSLANDSDFRVRTAAAKGLSRTLSDAAVDPLMKVLASDPNPQVRAGAASALGHIGARRSIGALETARKDADADVQMEASFAIETILRQN